ncbi:MAG TPA: hypothetical protein PLI57_01245, partial [Spirochaetota bacterium]|nr:hypothetical protein [Spirochaetota bacterium]
QANPYNLYVAAVDKVGNVGYTSRSFFIDQDLDKPTASILVPVANGVTVFPESTATGGAIDDDGLARIYIFIGKTSVYNDTNLPADKNTWGTYSDATACGYVIDLPTHPTNYSWSVKTPGGAGTYKMWVLPVDINSPATEGTYETRTFNQATSSTPSISVLTNPSTTYMGDLTIDVQATGGGAKTVKSIGYRIFSTKLGPTLGTLTGVSSSPGAGQFLIATSVSTSFKFDTSLYTSDTVVDVRVDVWVTNEDDVTSQESTVYYRADNTKPVVTITSPGAGTTINGNQYISGTANDWSQVEALYFGYFTSANPPDMLSYYTTKSRLDADSILSTSDPTTDKWHKVESPSINWTYAFRTEDVTKDIDAGFKLYVVAVDKVGNVNYVVRAYTIDQDMDKPMITITNPGYSGAEPAVVRNDGEMAFIPRTYVMMGTVQDGDQDGIRNVHIDIDILANNGDHSADVYPPNASGDTGDGYNNVSSVEPMILGDALTSWTYKISNYALSLPGEFYRVRVRPIDAHGKLGLVRSSYFVVTNVAPEVEIISPSILDPDTPEATNPDVYGTVISNVKDDIYWDADPNNNLIYYDDDSNRRNWGWNTDLFEESFNIFNNTVPGSADATRSNYYRMIFRAKDNGRINTVEISVDGGANTAAELSWSGGITSADGHFNQTIHDSAKIKAVDVMKRKVLKGNYFDYTYENMDTTNDATSDWVYFFVDIDTTKLSPSAMFKVTVGDNNDPSSYETTASVQVNVDNSAPTGSILNWGIDSLTEKHEFSKTGSAYQYIAGDLSDFGSAGVRYANLYFWNNMETDLDAMPNYKENGSGLITVNDPTNVPSGVHKVSIPENLGSVLVKNGVGDIGDVNPASSVSDNYPNSWIRAYKYLSSGWRVRYIYTNDESPSDADGNPGTYYGISTKYGDVYPSDGKKLICLEVVDNAGNKARKFYEHTFSEYPPTVTDANISWGSLPEEPVTDETPAGRKWISNSFSMNGVVRDYVAGTNPTPGIERVRVYIMKDDNGDGIPESTQRIYTSKTSEHDVPDSMHNNKKPVKVINTAPDISEDPTGDANPVTWGFISAQSINLLDGNYMIMVEVRDKTGSTARKRQYVYLDKSAPTLVVNQPTNNQVVKGDLFVISGTASDAAGGGFNAGCVNIKILDATSDALKREWNTSLDSSNNWTQDWSLISDASDDFDISESRKVRVTLTDKAGNTHTLPDIIVKKGAPPSWHTFEANGSSTSFNNAPFKSKYTTIGASDPLFMIRGATSTFETQIQDSVVFTGAELKVTGYRQSDGAYLSSATPGFETLLATKTLDPNTGGVVGGNVTYTYDGLPDGEYEYKVELHQEAALINMRRYFIVDNTKPNIWVKKIENTDYVLDGAAKLGHVDRNEDFSAAGYTTGTDAETGIVGADMVSGVIRFHIKAKDNYRLKRIRAKMTDLAFIGALGGGYYTLAYRDNTDNWTVAAQRGSITSGVATRDYMKVTNVTGSVIGHNYDYVYLIVEFNTAQLTNVAGLNKHLEIVAEDWVGNLTDYTGGARPKNTGTISDSLFYGAGTEIITKDSNLSDDNAKAVKFVLDVVPYITEIETADRLNGGLKSNNIRSASGKYSIIQGSSGSFITVRGYNLNPITNGTRIVSSASSYKNGLNGTALQGVYIAFTGSGSPYTSLTLTNNSSNSGYLAIVSGTVANPVGSINNVNSNSVETNKEADHYITRNPTLTDDRYLRFFSTKQTPTRNGYYPNMIMDSDDNPVFGYVDMSGGTAASGAGNYFPSHAMPQRTKYNLSDGTKNDTTEYLVKASIWEQMGMAKDDGGRYYHATLYNRDGCGFALIYDRFAELHDTTNMVGWGAGTTYSNITSYPQRSAVQDTGNNAIALETTSYSSLLLDRYKYPKLIAKGNSATNYATLYMLYFDDNTTNKDLIFRNLQIGTNAGNRTTALHSGYGRYTNFTENTGNSDSWESGRLTAASGASQYFDMAVTSGNIVVVVYYDETAGRLKMRYSDAAVTGANPTTAITWNNSPVVFPNYVGNYVSMAIDAGNGIHIAAFNATDADLTYIYVPNHTVNSKAVATVDAYGSIGQWTQIKMRGNVPHIAYYNSTETGTRESIKYAYANFNVTAVGDVLPGVDAGNYTTGNWEYMTIPALTPPQGGIPKFKQVNLDFHSSGRPVFGYLGTFIEFSMPVAE